MNTMSFSPKLRTGTDVIERWLLTVAQYLLVAGAAALPLAFFPHLLVSIGFTKVFFTLVVALSALVVFSLFVLRIGTVRVVAPYVLLPLWGVALWAVVSALLSGDRLDALVGDTMQIQTAAFFLIIALLTTVTASVLDAKAVVIRFFFAFAAVAFVLQLWHVVRFFFGTSFLSLGIFNSPTVSMVGSFNDLALFAGLVIILSVVGLQQLPLRGRALWFVSALVGLSLVVLSVVNFFMVWLVVGFFSLVVLLYTLTRDRLFGGESTTAPVSKAVLAIVGFICVVAAVFVVAGSYVGGGIGNALGIQYLEVRPSFSTTVDVLGATYKESALLGSGPNRFEDAWRAHKNPVINETLFWNTSFAAGSGYIPTAFVTLGIVGGALIVVFLLSFVYAGYRMLVVAQSGDSFWYFVATAAVAAAVYLWGMAIVYVPGATMLLLAAFWTGLALVAYTQLVPSSLKIVNFTQNRPRAFVLIGLVMVTITGAVAALFVTGKQYAAHVVYANAVLEDQRQPNFNAAEIALDRAFILFGSDAYLTERVQLRLQTLGALLNAQSLTEEDQQTFQTNAISALQLAREAVALDATNPANRALLGSIYGVLAITGVSDALPLSNEAFAEAKRLDPQNPEYALVEAQIATRLGDVAKAREHLTLAIALKPNYVDALYLLSQLDVTEGNTEAAIATARAIVTIEPGNPARYFQLGALLVATQDLSGARAAYEAAITIDPNFANARYLLALILIEQGDRQGALAQLQTVLTTNQDNQGLKDLIAALESGEGAIPALGITPPVNEPTVNVDAEGVTTTNEPTGTDLIVPVNQGGAGASEEVPTPSSSQNDAAQPETSQESAQ